VIADDAGVGTPIYWLPATVFAWGVSSGSRQVCLPTRLRPSHRILDEPGHAPVLALLGLVISVPVSMPARDARLTRIFGTLPAQSQFDRMEPRRVFAREETGLCPRRNGEAGAGSRTSSPRRVAASRKTRWRTASIEAASTAKLALLPNTEVP